MVEDGRMALLPRRSRLFWVRSSLSSRPTSVKSPRYEGSALCALRHRHKREENAIKEAQRLNIPVVALIDTNSDPDEVDYGVPCNDDAISAVSLMCELFADACLAGAGRADFGLGWPARPLLTPSKHVLVR